MVSTRSPKPLSLAQKSWSLYNLLLIFRVCVAPFFLGYVHPDEFFQGGQELWFGCPPATPWEFEPQNALRSIVPPSVMTWWPLRICAAVLGLPIEHLSGWHVWIIPRVACAIFSIFTVDRSVWALSSPRGSSTGAGVPIPVLLLASAWPTMVLLNRPFTNAMETWVLAMLLRTVLQGRNAGAGLKKMSPVSLTQCLTVGALSAIGIFTRFTFVCFAFPIVAYFGYRMIRSLGFWGWVFKPPATYLSFLLVATQIMDLDTSYYASRAEDDNTPPLFFSFVVAPLNAFRYNFQVENLQEHGLHPRWTHAVVNMVLLYGPMALIAYVVLGSWKILFAKPIDNEDDVEAKSKSYSDKDRTTISLCKWILVFGLGLLSMAPHQEPRFLLPLLVPLVLLGDHPWIPRLKHISTIWLVFNMTLLLFFGILHQAGVVPSLLALGSSLKERKPEAVFYYHTYMPPTFLSRPVLQNQTCSADKSKSCPSNGTACQNIAIVDLNGSNNLSSLRDALHESLDCKRAGLSDKGLSIQVVTAPLQEMIYDERWYFGSQYCVIPGYSCEPIWNHNPHLTTEYSLSIADIVREGGLPLSIYEVTCQ